MTATPPSPKACWNESADRTRCHAHPDGSPHAGAGVETTLYERLIRLYKGNRRQVALQGPVALLDRLVPDLAKNIHSSLFLNIYEYLSRAWIWIRWNC